MTRNTALSLWLLGSLCIAGQRVVASVLLIKPLGRGWNGTQSP